jgi:AAA family ATP:ADP antiporter
MSSRLDRTLGRIVTLWEGEGTTAVLMFAYSFLAMTSYNIVKPITRSKFISGLGADNLPYVLLAAGVLIGVLMHLYSWAIRGLPRRAVIPVTQAGAAALLVVFWFLFQSGAVWVSVAFYLLGLILGILLISQFWTLANDVYDPRQAKRLFGFIGGGASLGGATGAGLTSVAVAEVGTDNLLLVSAALLGVCLALVMAIERRERIAADFSAAGTERGVGGSEALMMLRASRQLQVIALVIGFAAVGAAIIEQQLNMAAATMGERGTDAITAFLARVTFYLSLVGFLVQVGLTSRIHRSLGLAFALVILPVSLGTTATIILLNGALWAPAVARVLDTSLRYTVDKTTREVLFLPLPADLKYRAKPFVDVTMDRFAKAVGALLLLVLIKPWGLNLDWQRLSYASLVVTVLWIVAALRARTEYLKAFRRSIEAGALVPDAIRLNVADGRTIETLVEELSSPDEARVLYAIDVLESLDRRNLVTPLLLHHESPKVRARVLHTLESVRGSMSARWLPAIERMLLDPTAEVRAAAVGAMAALRKEEAATLMRTYLSDPEPRIAMTAAVVLANSGRDADEAAAEEAFRRFADDRRDATGGARKELAAALAQVTSPRFRPLLIPLLLDADQEVAQEAIQSARATGTVDLLLVPALVSLLGHRALKHAARDTLVSYGQEVVPALSHFLTDPGEHVWVRRQIPSVLALIATQQSMDVLTSALDDPDGFLRYKAIVAIEKLRRDHGELRFEKEPAETLLVIETQRYYGYLTLRYTIAPHDPAPMGGRESHRARPRPSMLVRALDDKLERTLDRIYRLMGLLYPWKDVAAARYTIEHGEPRSRAGAIEYMDNLLSGAVRRNVMPILEDAPAAEKVRNAYAMLKSAPVDVEEAIGVLIDDEDQVIAAAAIHYVEEQQIWSLSNRLEHSLEHRSAADWYVFEAASWSLAAHRLSGRKRQELWIEPLPVIELANRLRAIPLFDFVSIDELFRIAAASRQIRHEEGREIYREGEQPDEVHFVLDGHIQFDAEGYGAANVKAAAPTVVGFENLLEGRPLRHTVRAVERTICLTVRGDELLTMLSDNVVLAQGLFRMLLDAQTADGWRAVYTPPVRDLVAPRTLPLQPLDKVLLLRQNPLLTHATVEQLLDLATITREMVLTPGDVLFNESDAPAMYSLLSGEVQLSGNEHQPLIAGAGTTIGISETLAGTPLGVRAVVAREGAALRLDHEELFDVLADHVDLLQGVFSGLLRHDTGVIPSRGRAASPAHQ